MAIDPYPEIIYTGKGLEGFTPFTEAVKKYEAELAKTERITDKHPGIFHIMFPRKICHFEMNQS